MPWYIVDIFKLKNVLVQIEKKTVSGQKNLQRDIYILKLENV